MLRKEADDMGSESGGVGLLQGLDEFIDDNPGTTATAAGGEEAQPAMKSIDDSVPGSEESSEEKEEAPRDAPDDEIEDFDPGLPNIGEEDVVVKDEKTDDFDPAAFDEQTAVLLKAIEDKGHPGDVFKAQREELKAYKEAGSSISQFEEKIAALEAEKAALQEKADEVEAMREKVQGITSRNAELYLEELPEYKSQVVEPHNEITETVAAMAAARGVDESEIWSAIKQKDLVSRNKAIDDLEAKIGSRNALAVQQISGDLRKIAKLDQEMRSNAEEVVAKAKLSDQKASESEVAQNAGIFKASTSESFDRYAKKIPGFTDDTGNLTDAAKSARGRGSSVDFQNLKPNDVGYMVFTAQALPQALKHIKALENENRDLRVAAGAKAKDIAVGSTVKKSAPDDDIDTKTGEQKTFLSGFLQQDFASAT